MAIATIAGSNVARTTLIDAATKVPQRAEWVVIDGRLQPATFVQQLDHFEGNTIGAVADSAQVRVTTLEAHRHQHRSIGWSGLGAVAVGAVVAAMTPLNGLGIALAVGGGLTANYGLVSAKWEADEIASTQGFVEELGEWGAILSAGPAPQAVAP